MNKSKKSALSGANDGPDKADDPDKRKPEPDDPNEEVAMPPKEMPKKSHPHEEEITNYDFVADYDFIAK